MEAIPINLKVASFRTFSLTTATGKTQSLNFQRPYLWMKMA